ncbi:MAG: hypothetical protein WBA54_12130 [Acidaminobacteraceae bacterium]
MKYRLKNHNAYVQVTFSLLIIIGPIILWNPMYMIISSVIGLLMLKDAFKNLRVEYEIDEKGLKVFGNETLKKSIKWSDVEFLTISKKNKNWVVIGNKKVTIMLKPSIIGFEELMESTVKYVAKRKKVYINEMLL